MTTKSYMSEVVSYGGLPTTRGDMILDLQRIAATHTDDPARQQRLVDMGLMGHAQAERMHGNPFEGFATVEEARQAIFESFAA